MSVPVARHETKIYKARSAVPRHEHNQDGGTYEPKSTTRRVCVHVY